MHFGDFHPYYQNSFALVIGINEYEYASPLAYAKNDAESVASLLVEQLNFLKETVTLLKDKDATKNAILETYLDYIKISKSQDDRILFFFAGHGLTFPGYKGDVGYLVPVNGEPEKPGSLIRWDDLTRNADLIPAKHILFILDACFSGLALKRAVNPNAERFLSEMLQRRARQVITAGKADEVVADGGGPNGENSIFTGHLIEGLKGMAAGEEGTLTGNGLMYYVYNKLAHDPASQQTPHYGHIDGDGDFVFITSTGNLDNFPEQDLIIETPPEMPEVQQTLSPSPYPSFSESNGYSKPLHPNFGRNQYSNNLGVQNFDSHNEEKAFSWFSLVIEPTAEVTLEANLSQLVKKFSHYEVRGEAPFERFVPPIEKMTSINSIVLFDKLNYQSQYWKNYVRIEKSGNFEYCDAYYSFYSYRGVRAFRYIQIIGLTWQFVFFVKSLLEEMGYKGAARLTINLIGTKETILADFAKGTGKDNQHWIEPGSSDAFGRTGLLDLKCLELNLQMQYNLIFANINEKSSQIIIEDVAEKLGLAYNHQSEPRCFNYGTNIYPWNQFFSNRGY